MSHNSFIGLFYCIDQPTVSAVDVTSQLVSTVDNRNLSGTSCSNIIYDI